MTTHTTPEIHTLSYPLHGVTEYINWIYFFHTWGYAPAFYGVTEVHDCASCRAQWIAGFEGARREQARSVMALYEEALEMLRWLDERFTVKVRFALFAANSDGDDVVLQGGVRLPFLRQQSVRDGGPYLCLSDFVRPLGGTEDCMGVFVATAGPELEGAAERFFPDDDYKRLLVKTLAERLAEAATERMHLEVRRHYWGYAPEEHLSIHDLHLERFRGIRPAVGYPSLPDQSINFLLDRLIDFSAIGVRVTENGAMHPHATVSGLMLAHPASRYFSVGPIGEDQLVDYARRRGMEPGVLRKFLAANLPSEQ